MHHPTTRDRYAAGLFGLLAVLAVGGAMATGSLVLVALALITVVAALASLRGYPIDRNW